MPNFDKQYVLKGPCPIKLEAELQHLTPDEKAAIFGVIQKDIKFKEAIAFKREDKEILDDWGRRVKNMTTPLLATKGNKFNFVKCLFSIFFIYKSLMY